MNQIQLPKSLTIYTQLRFNNLSDDFEVTHHTIEMMSLPSAEITYITIATNVVSFPEGYIDLDNNKMLLNHLIELQKSREDAQHTFDSEMDDLALKICRVKNSMTQIHRTEAA